MAFSRSIKGFQLDAIRDAIPMLVLSYRSMKA